MTPAESTLQSRISNTAHRDTVRNLFCLTARVANEREKLKADNNLSDEGRRAREAALAKSLVKDHVHMTRPLRRAQADIAAKRTAFKLPEIDRSDVVSEMQRAELRAYIRGLPLDERTPAVFGLGDVEQLAILSAPSLLSGLPEERHARLKTEFMDRRFGKQQAALEIAGEEVEALNAAATMTRRELMVASGLSDADYQKAENAFEH